MAIGNLPSSENFMQNYVDAGSTKQNGISKAQLFLFQMMASAWIKYS
jgi:hypothetical protein